MASGRRKGGTPVDIEGETIGILARMGMIDTVRAKALPPPRGFEFKTAGDRTIGMFGGQPDLGDEGEKYEIHRDDLLAILFASIEGVVQVVFGQSKKQLEAGPDSVGVTFGDGSRQDYALVFGCDGNRSNTSGSTQGIDGLVLGGREGRQGIRVDEDLDGSRGSWRATDEALPLERRDYFGGRRAALRESDVTGLPRRVADRARLHGRI